MKYIYFDCFAGFDVQMALGALADMTKDTATCVNTAKALVESSYFGAFEVKRQSIEATLAHYDFDIETDIVIEEIIEKSIIDDSIKSGLQLWLKLRTNDGQSTDDKRDVLKEFLYAAACLALIKDTDAEAVYISEISQGSGISAAGDAITVIPSPHTEFLCKMADIHTKDISTDKEILTPGGAALLYTIGAKYMPQKMHNIIKSGYGAGAEDMEIPNITRCILANDSDDELSLNFESVISDMYTEFAVLADGAKI